MASKAVIDAVSARLAANWTLTPIFLSNTGGGVPADNSAFLSLTFPVANEVMKSTGDPGNNVWRETGGFRIVLAAPEGTTTDPWAAQIDTLRAVFRGKSFAGINCFEASPPMQNDNSDIGGYFELAFVVTYHFDIRG